MSLPQSLNIALKEWNVVCHALLTGRQVILLRKGGIHEGKGGFELDHPQFLLFPTYLHQNPMMLKVEGQAGLETFSSEPEKVTLRGVAEVTDIIRLKERSQMDGLDSEHIWMPPLIDMRFNYKPQNPLYLLILRAHQLAEPVTIDNTAAYAGCKSWVPLSSGIDIQSIRPVLSDDEFDARQRRILSHI